MHDAGIDISKPRLDLCVIDETAKIVHQDELPNNQTGHEELTELVGPETPVGLEVGTLAYPVHDHLVERGYTVRLGDSQRMKTIWQCDQKFDGKDAFEIADLVRIDKFPEVHIPDPEVLEARELIRACKDVVEQCTQAKQRLGAWMRREGIQAPFGGKTLYSEEGLGWLREQELDAGKRALMEAFVSRSRPSSPGSSSSTAWSLVSSWMMRSWIGWCRSRAWGCITRRCCGLRSGVWIGSSRSGTFGLMRVGRRGIVRAVVRRVRMGRCGGVISG